MCFRNSRVVTKVLSLSLLSYLYFLLVQGNVMGICIYLLMSRHLIFGIFKKCPMLPILDSPNNQATERNIEHQLNLKQQRTPYTRIYWLAR